ncbi:nmrA-like family domain-containing protein 1 [Aspergillus udagawae]|uniref:NmrA-like family domain-containing protein 1 n=1 Tax=Aspergillus udagawae TaxID=91492 RepID=A0A8H3S9E1_9EURO|nr:nmrA-like family domain-containing protein 1 [Aspergillus udagawae]
MTASKLLVVIGITGNQGSSVASAFLKLPDWRIRGISRDISSAAAQQWISKGVELVQADLDDIDSLENAFHGASTIFAVTDFYSLMLDPANFAAAQQAGVTPNEYACNLETKRGMNIATAANSPSVSATLTHFVFSSLSDTKYWSHGKYTCNYHFDGKAAVVKRIKKELPGLAEKLSIIQGGMGRPQKQKDGTFVVQIPDIGEVQLPWIYVDRDVGIFVEALLATSPGKQILGVSQMASWREFWTLWAETGGVKLEIQVVSVEEFFQSLPVLLRREFQESLRYIVEFGYTGGDSDVCGNLQDMLPGAKTATLKDYMESEDWSILD